MHSESSIDVADGTYKTGTADSGYYTITISKVGFVTQTFTNVFLNNGIITNLNVSLYANQAVNFTGKTIDNQGNDIINCSVLMEDSINNYSFISNNLGEQGQGLGRLLVQGRIRCAIGSYFTSNPDVARWKREHGLEVRLMPQGTMVEAIRAGGAGIGPVRQGRARGRHPVDRPGP